MFNFEISWIFLIITILSLAVLAGFWTWKNVQYDWLDKVCTLLVISFPFQGFPSLLGEVANLRISQVIVAVGLSLVFILLLKKDSQLLQQKIHPFFYWAVSFILVSIPGWLFVENFGRFSQFLLGTLLVFGATFLLTHFAENLWRKVKYLVLAMFFACVFAGYQFVGDMVGLTDYTLLRPQYTAEVFGIPRVHSFFAEPLFFAGGLFFPILAMLLAILARQSLVQPGSKLTSFLQKWRLGFLTETYNFQLGLALIFLVFFVLTYSKSAFLALFVVLLVILFLMIQKYKDWKTLKLLGIFGSLGATFVGILAIVSTSLRASLTGIFNNFYGNLLGNATSSAERDHFTTQAWDFLPEYAVTGTGLGQYGPIAAFPLRFLGGSETLVINNTYLEVWFEYGLAAFFLFILFWTIVLLTNWRVFSQTKNWKSKETVLRLGLVLSLIAYLIQWWFFSPLYIMPIFVLLGLLLALSRKGLIETSPDSEI